MNINDMIKQMQGQKPESVLTRKPTIEEIDLFIDRVMKEKDETLYSMHQAIVFKLERQPHSLVESEIYPLVLERLVERYNKED